ncbi:MAG: hypothetical protein IJ111_04440 [Eggerthellaceae bacterium]|nr:hypothetical protein [Eggerthellaceae bacterium]
MTNLELERFSVNDYRGLDDAPAFQLRTGKLPVIISAPHAVSQRRAGKVKPSDDFTGPIAIVASELADCHAVMATRFDECDPNWDPFEQCRYKQALAAMVREQSIVAVIDVHGVPSASPYAVEVGSADGLSVSAMPGADEFARDFLAEELAPYLAKHGKTIALNESHAARGANTVTNAISRECGIAALQLELATPFRVPQSIGGHTPEGEAPPFSEAQLPKEISSRRNPDPTCVEVTVRAIAHLATTLADFKTLDKDVR